MLLTLPLESFGWSSKRDWLLGSQMWIVPSEVVVTNRFPSELNVIFWTSMSLAGRSMGAGGLASRFHSRMAPSAVSDCESVAVRAEF